MKLHQLFPGTMPPGGAPEIGSIVWDSRLAVPDALFFCLPGAVADGHDFAAAAYERGCRAFVVEHDVPLPDDALRIVVPDARVALAEASAAFYGHPADRLTLIGITGTKGKTSVAYFIYGILCRCGIRAALIGTTGLHYGDVDRPTDNTTPESAVLQSMFAEVLEAGVTHVVMEVSSQAFKLRRVHGLHFAHAVYTNLSPDHIGPREHADFAEYLDCKAQLFANAAHSLLNADDPWASYMASAAAGTVETYGIAGKLPARFPAELLPETPSVPLPVPIDLPAVTISAKEVGRTWEAGIPGVSFLCNGVSCAVRMPGEFAVSNALAALGVCRALGVDMQTAADALRQTAVPGRFEPIEAPEGCTFIVDYAHNGLSLRTVLGVLRSYAPKRLICLIGSVGGRSQIRRAELGETAGRLADLCIFTADNPDSEDPAAICAEMESACRACGGHSICIPDRREAILYAVSHARPGDIVLFAGKGHETYQYLHGQKLPFSERAIIRECLRAQSAAKK